MDISLNKDFETGTLRYYLAFYTAAVDLAVTVNNGGWLQIEFILDDTLQTQGKY